MNCYYFELYVDDILSFKEIFTVSSTEEATKYIGYKEQSLREIKDLKCKIHSYVFNYELKTVNTEEIDILEKNLSKTSLILISLIPLIPLIPLILIMLFINLAA